MVIEKRQDTQEDSRVRLCDWESDEAGTEIGKPGKMLNWEKMMAGIC